MVIPSWAARTKGEEDRAGGNARLSRLAGRIGGVAAVLVLGMPTTALAAGADGSRAGAVLFGLAVLVLAAKLGGLLAERSGQPAVLGELLVGIGLGNVFPLALGLAFVRNDPTLAILAEAGVLVLLFDVGLETDLRAVARVGLSSLLVALIGVAVPFGLGWAVSAWLVPESPRLVHLFMSACLTATSVGITARVLRDLRVSHTPEAQTILGAAVIDDVLGLIILAVITGSVTGAGTSGTGVPWGDVSAILLKAVGFLAVTIAAGHFLSGPLVHLTGRARQPALILVVGVALCFTLAYAAELIGLAGIIGAFAAGLLLDPYGEGVRGKDHDETLAELLHPLSALFVPLFFVLMGIRVDLASVVGPGVLTLGIALIFVALVGKLACALGVVRPGIRRLPVAIGMVPRGEVGLIFAGIGAGLSIAGQPLLSHGQFSALVLMVLVTTLVTPVGLRWAFGRPR